MSGGPNFKTRVKLDTEKAFELWQMGYHDQAIADECEVTFHTIGKWRRRHDLPANPVPESQKKRKKKSRLSICAEEATKRGLTYGQYMATLYR